MPTPAIAVVVPAWNEESRLGGTLERILAYLAARDVGFEIVVADDGSADATAEVARRFAERGVRLVRLPENRGKGAAVKKGVAATTAPRVLISDADLSTPIEELARLEDEIDTAELVIGSRDVESSRVVVHQPWYRSLAGRIFNRLVRLFAVRGYRDTQCGFKLGRGPELRALCAELTVERFAWDVELIWLALERDYRVVEVGVEWHDHPATRVHLVRDSSRMLFDILRFRWRHRGRTRRGDA